MYGNYGRRSPSPLRNQVGPLRRGSGRLGIIPPPPPPPPPSEPDRDEAFVQETGIKVYTSVPPRVVKRREDSVQEEDHDHSDEVDDDDEDDDEDDEDGDDDDDCYEIIMDDAIIEEDNEDDDDDDDTVQQSKPGVVDSSSKSVCHGETHGKDATKETSEPFCESKDVSSKSATGNACNVDTAFTSNAHQSLSANKSSSGVSSNGSSSGVLHGSGTGENIDEKMPPVKINDPVEVSNLIKPMNGINSDAKSNAAPQTNSSAGSGSDMSRSSSNGSNNSVKMTANLSTSLKGLNLILSPTSTTAPTQAYTSLSTHGTPTKESPGDLFLARGKPGRMSLPLRDRFIARPAVLQDSSGHSATLDSRAKEGSLRPTRTIWFRRSMKNPPTDAGGGGGSAGTPAGAAKLQQQQQLQQGKARDIGKKDDGGWASGDEMGGSLGPSPRPRSDTWSLATSRRKEKRSEKEEEARLRRRRKSGDDIHMLATADATLLHQPITSSGFERRRRNDGGFFDSFRPRSKSDAKAILQARQRRRSGEDPITTSTGGSREAPALGSRDRKKEASPGFFESIRPRSKSDAARLANKKPNLMTTMKNAVQHTLVSPGGGGGGGSGRSGRRSGENTPPLDARMGATAHHGEDYHHFTWHPGSSDRSKTSSLFKVFDIFRVKNPDDRGRRPAHGKGGDRGRRNSGDQSERMRQASGSLTSVYIRGCDPAGAASVFRESRGLPSADPRLQQLAKEEESQILVKFFQLHRSHDLIPTSAKLVIFDTSLQVKKAFYALVHNGVRAAPLWDRDKQKFVGLLTITDFIRILHSFHLNQDPQMENLEDHRLHMWRTFLKDDDRPLIHISPEDSLYEAIRLLIHHKIHRLPVIDPATGNVLYIITHKRILKFLYLYINELPKPQVLQKTLAELGIGTYTDIETATHDTLIIEALDKFVKHRVSALPIVDSEGKLIDIYAKFDVINLAAEGTYNNLNVTLRQANESRNEWFEGVQHCTKDERLCTVMDRIVRAEVHRLVVVDDSRKVIGVISLSDILKELVLKPCGDENLLKKTSVCDMVKDEAAPPSSTSSPSPQPPLSPASAAVPLTKSGSEESCGDTEGIGSPERGKVSSGDSEDEGRYSMDKSEETPPVPSPEGIPISG